MSELKLKYGSEQELNNTEFSEGTIYFIRKDPTNQEIYGNIYYDLPEGTSIEKHRILISGAGFPGEGDGAEIFNVFGESDPKKASGQQSHAEGRSTQALSRYSHAEGYKAIATAPDSIKGTGQDYSASHAEGNLTQAIGNYGPHAEGFETIASGNYGSHAEGHTTKSTGGNGSHAEGYYTEASGGNGSHAEGNSTKASGHSSHAEGNDTIAIGTSSHAEGCYTKTEGNYSHVEGLGKDKNNPSLALGIGSHAEGFYSQALAKYTHAEGVQCVAGTTEKDAQGNDIGTAAHAEGGHSKAIGYCNHAEGHSTIASGEYGSHAEGFATKASGGYGSHAEGTGTYEIDPFKIIKYTEASGQGSHAEGQATTASGYYSHAEGMSTIASNDGAHAEGYSTTASGKYSHAEGQGGTASGLNSHASGQSSAASGQAAHAMGYLSIANSFASTAVGYLNKELSGNDIFVVGNGNTTSETRNNAFRVNKTGVCYGGNSISGTGADFAEYFEWNDENINSEDRRGLFVTLENNKIRLANLNDDYILGAITTDAAFIGNAASEDWKDKYVKNIFNEIQYEEVEFPAEYSIETIEKINEETGEIIVEEIKTEISPARITLQPILNPNYNLEQEYISREFRKEWAPVGLCGQVIVVDDGTCEVNGYCRPYVDGIASSFTVDNIDEDIPQFMKEFYLTTKGFKVIERLDDTHIKIVIK